MSARVCLCIAPAAAWLLGCSEFREPYDLRYARILAVRATPPALLAGERARIDILVTNDEGAAFEASPMNVTPASGQPGQPPAPAQDAAFFTREAGGWFVTAPSEVVLEAIRVALGLAPDAPIAVPLEITVSFGPETKLADKLVLLGTSASNPEVSAIELSGLPLGDLETPVALDTEHQLSATATGDGPLSYAWYSAIGKLARYREPVARLIASQPGRGALVVVVRDGRGGVAWKLAALRAE